MFPYAMMASMEIQAATNVKLATKLAENALGN